jgi:acetyltransferase-like isoleucine patch superfamily enzyme
MIAEVTPDDDSTSMSTTRRRADQPGGSPRVQPHERATIAATTRRAVEYGQSIARGAHPRYVAAYAVASLIPPFTAGGPIARLYRAAGFRIGLGTSFGGPVRLVGSPDKFEANLIVGSNVLISTDVTINIDDVVQIGDFVSVGPFVRIYTASHSVGPGSRRMMPHVVGRPVTIERGAWIGLGAMILPGVTIGHGSVVGAGSVVTSDVPPNTYVEGNPARVARDLPWGDR